MKKGSLLLCLLFPVLVLSAAGKTWTGQSGSNWNNAGNWSPAGVPVAGDDINFNTSVTVVIDISPVSVNSLHITGNVTVLFETGATRNIRLFSTSAANPALLIESGSTFIFDGTNTGTNNSTIELYHGSGVTASIYGTLIFSCTGGASGGPHISTYNSVSQYGILTVYNGGVIRISAGAGNTISSTTPVPTIVMDDGSVYENLKNGGSFPAGTWADNSLARCQSPGNIGAVFNGTVYGNLEWNCSAQTTAAFLDNDISFNNVQFISTNSSATNGEFRIKTGASASAYTMTIRGDVTLSANARIRITSSTVSPGYGGTIVVEGDIINNGTITSGGGTGTINDLKIAGAILQSISNSGNISGSQLLFTINNPSGLELLTPLTLPGNLFFSTGKIFTSAINILTMVDNATYSGGSPVSFVEGPMQKTGNDDFIFPVGVGNIYAPIGMVTVSGEATTDTFTAQYIRTDPRSVYGTNYENPIDHVSMVEHWSLVRNSGNASKKITLNVSATSFAANLSSLLVSRFNTTDNQWKNEGVSFMLSGTSYPPYVTGMITGNNVNNFGIFTLATTDPPDLNPLPIRLVRFDVSLLADRTADIRWQTASPCSKDARFELQRSAGNSNFKTIAMIRGSEANLFFYCKDTEIETGINHYRLKMTDKNGNTTFSKIVVVVNNNAGDLTITSLSPVPVRDNAALRINSKRNIAADIVLYNVTGAVVKQWKEQIAKGNSVITFETGCLKPGVYELVIIADGQLLVKRFVKL